MPERDKAVLYVAGTLVDGEVPDPSNPVSTLLGLQPRGVRRAQWQGLQAIIDYLLIEMLERINWSRVLLTAGSRHRRMEELHPDHATDSAMLSGLHKDDPICGDCIIEALMSESTMGPKEDGTPVERHPLWRKDWLDEGGGAVEILKALAPRFIQAAENGRLESGAYEGEA